MYGKNAINTNLLILIYKNMVLYFIGIVGYGGARNL